MNVVAEAVSENCVVFMRFNEEKLWLKSFLTTAVQSTLFLLLCLTPPPSPSTYLSIREHVSLVSGLLSPISPHSFLFEEPPPPHTHSYTFKLPPNPPPAHTKSSLSSLLLLKVTVTLPYRAWIYLSVC